MFVVTYRGTLKDPNDMASYDEKKENLKHELIDGQVLTIGRGKNNVFCFLGDGSVARVHAAMFLIPGADQRLAVIDLKSTNGTRVKGVKRLVHFLAPGDEFVVARTHLFRFESTT